VRAFIALEIPEPTRLQIAAVVASLRPRLAGVRWVAPPTMHLTLRFLGDATPKQLERLGPALAAAAAACPPRDIRMAGLGLFPERGRPRVVWLGTQLPTEILALQRSCEAAAVSAGFAPESKPFRSHITLGRWRASAPRPELPAIDLGVVGLASLVVFKSELHPRGAIHEALSRFDLGGDAG
jgi:RNA 2',3'-cyclic 3'-phosphodiesterase